MVDVNAALSMIGTFAAVGVTNFDLSVVEHFVTDDNKSYDIKVPGKQLTNAHFRELHFRIGKILHEAEGDHHSVILRPRPITAVLLIQLDDLAANQVDKVKPHVFLTIRTSPGKYLSWIALGDASRDKEAALDFGRRFRTRMGGDPAANGASRIAGSCNFKPKYGPDFPLVQIVDLCDHVAEYIDLDDEPLRQPCRAPVPGFVARPKRKRGHPSYPLALKGAPLRRDGSGPDRSKSDYMWCKWDAERGYSVEETAAELLVWSERAQEELARGNAAYALLKARAGHKAAGMFVPDSRLLRPPGLSRR